MRLQLVVVSEVKVRIKCRHQGDREEEIRPLESDSCQHEDFELFAIFYLFTSVVAKVIEEEGLKLLGWREVPVDESVVGPFALATLPKIEQVLVQVRSMWNAFEA